MLRVTVLLFQLLAAMFTLEFWIRPVRMLCGHVLLQILQPGDLLAADLAEIGLGLGQSQLLPVHPVHVVFLGLVPGERFVAKVTLDRLVAVQFRVSRQVCLAVKHLVAIWALVLFLRTV